MPQYVALTLKVYQLRGSLSCGYSTQFPGWRLVKGLEGLSINNLSLPSNDGREDKKKKKKKKNVFSPKNRKKFSLMG